MNRSGESVPFVNVDTKENINLFALLRFRRNRHWK